MILKLTGQLALNPADVSTLAWDSTYDGRRTLVITMRNGTEYRVPNDGYTNAYEVEKLLIKATAAARD
jgi:hypothetical protein